MMKSLAFLTASLVLSTIASANTLTYNNDIKPIFESRCVFCHTIGGPLPSWMEYQTAFQYRNRIVYALESGEMPLDNFTNMTESERELIYRWVRQGAPEGSSDPVKEISPFAE